MALGNFVINRVKPKRVFRDELTLEDNGVHNGLNRRENLEALAQTLQNLVIIERGTYPNDPNLGVGVANYLFEINNADTINRLQNNIKSQVDHYVQYSGLTIDTSVEPSVTNNNIKSSNGVTIKFDIIPNKYEGIDGYQNPFMVELAVSMSNTSERLVTKLQYS